MFIQNVPYDTDFTELHKRFPDKYSYLLESVAQGTALARNDLLLVSSKNKLHVDAQLNLFRNGKRIAGDFFSALDQWLELESSSNDDGELLFNGGWFVYLGYEAAALIEPKLQIKKGQWPVAFAVRTKSALVRNHTKKTCQIISESKKDLVSILEDVSLLNISLVDEPEVVIASIDEEEEAKYIKRVEAVKHYVYEGDVFQANVARWWQVEVSASVSDAALYSALKKSNPAPFAALCKIGTRTIISSSPERLARFNHSEIEVRPIAGTIRRASDSEDAQEMEALIGHPKERAEHLMLIDLERNDLGRVCAAGSIEVNEMMVLESYKHVHHIVSNIRGDLERDTTAGDILKAIFPGGTITGCPKFRCMEIINELEDFSRGPYTGSLGYIARNGNADFNILIRTLARSETSVRMLAGAGIVADSIASKELDETRAKAKGLLGAFARGGLA